MSAAAVAQCYRGPADLPRLGASVRLLQDQALLLTLVSPSGGLLQHLYLPRCGPHFHFHSTHTLPVSYLALYSKLREASVSPMLTQRVGLIVVTCGVILVRD